MKGTLNRHSDLELLGQSIRSSSMLNGFTKQNGFMISFVNIDLCLLKCTTSGSGKFGFYIPSPNVYETLSLGQELHLGMESIDLFLDSPFSCTIPSETLWKETWAAGRGLIALFLFFFLFYCGKVHIMWKLPSYIFYVYSPMLLTIFTVWYSTLLELFHLVWLRLYAHWMAPFSLPCHRSWQSPL